LRRSPQGESLLVREKEKAREGTFPGLLLAASYRYLGLKFSEAD
jgi:hypothetical protein